MKITPMLLTLCCLSSAALAHQDPRGDIHPEIETESGNFAIYFKSNAIGDDFFYDRPQWRMVSSPEGKVILPRHKLSPEVQRLHDQSSARAAASVIVKKTRFVVHLADGGERPLPLDPVEGASVEKSNIVQDTAGFTWTTLSGDPDAAVELMFSSATTKGFAPGFTVVIGKPATIYQFPSASAPVWAGKRWWVAWVKKAETETEQKDPKRAWQTMLTSIDPVTKQIEHRQLEGLSHWNTDVSLKTTGGWLCAAWHAAVEGDYPGQAKIVTAFVKLP